MHRRLINFFIYSAGILLAITAIAKLISSLGDAGILKNPDPILTISFQHIFWIVGAVELVISFFCFFGIRVELRLGLIALLATNFVMYRIGLILIGYLKPCPCLGNLTDALHILPKTADTAMKIILAYLLIGSYATLFWLWRQHRKAEGRMRTDEVKPAGSSEMGVGS